MKKIMSAESAEEFAKITEDENCLHSNEEMWREYGVPALTPGMQTLITALASIDREDLLKLNYVRANFQRMIPVGSEVEFVNQRIRRGFWKGILPNLFNEGDSAQDIRISAYANGADTLAGSKDEPSLATFVELLEKPSFNEGDLPFTVKTNRDYLERFRELTGLPEEAVFLMYAVARSSSSIANRIKTPLSVPSWLELNAALVAPADKRKIPAYESLEAYFSDGFRPQFSNEMTLRSAIRKEGNVYVIDTICQAGDERIYGIRANLKQRRQEVIVKGIGALLDDLDKTGKAGTLSDAITRRKDYLAVKSKPESVIAA